MNTYRFRYEYLDGFEEQHSATVWAADARQAVAIVAEQLAHPLRLLGLDPTWDMVRLPGIPRPITRQRYDEQYRASFEGIIAALAPRGAHAA